MTTDTYRWEHGASTDPVLLCLHGIGSCADAFLPQQPLAARSRRRIVAWDAPGYRHSADPPAAPGIDGWADAAAGLLAAVGKTDDGGADGRAEARADVLGVSWGGVIATRLALRHPGLVRSLILADSSVGAGTDPATAEAMRTRGAVAMADGIETFARDRSPLLVNAAAPPDLVEEVARLMSDSIRLAPYQWAADSMADTDHRPDLASIGCPTLVIVGDEDVVTGPRAAQALADGIPDARLVTIAAAGHLANQERPEAFNDAVAAFLASLDR
ncbi:MAG: alpha/beta fold hydrolase [Acidimicrobiales bacterium]